MEVADLEEGLQHQPIWAQQRVFSILFSFFASLALMLSLVGLASTLSFAVARRRNELGIRMALGAQRSHVVWIVAKTTLATVIGGIAAGLSLSLSLQKLFQNWTLSSMPSPWILTGVTILLIISATIACFLPARRAANVDPMESLRCE